ncbi:hypothetical protein HDU85_001479 [Gaertneriomyces sp. JEL0708]|nr:hypothetical protein HDU85_001479 [Gaertneriomyces sp. JEL0708]
MTAKELVAAQLRNDESQLLLHPRPYQVELYQNALARNIIAYLDTGAGKTLVSVLLIQDFAQPLVEVAASCVLEAAQKVHNHAGNHLLPDDSNTLDYKNQHPPDEPKATREVAPGIFLPNQPKKIVFLVPTVPLVAQQAEKIRSNTDLVVGEYSRDDISSVAYWDAVGWYHEISKRHVLVFTPQIFLNVLRHGFMNLSRDVELLVIDECHHAVKLHPYNTIMKEFYHILPGSAEKPKILGMTASPVYQKAGTHCESVWRLEELQRNLDCTVVTVADRASLANYVPRAVEQLVEYSESHFASSSSLIVNGTLRGPDTLCIQYYRELLALLMARHSTLLTQNQQTQAEKLYGSVQQVIAMKDDLGWYLAALAAEELLRSAERFASSHTKVPIASTKLETKTARPSLADVTRLDVTPKVLTLIRLLEERASWGRPDQPDSAFRAMVFVERRWTAKFLSEFINALAQTRFPIIKCSYVTGHGSANAGSATHSKQTSMSSTHQTRAFNRFRSGECNIMIVTRVAEEGVDIPACRLIILFDMFRSHTGYVQSRGRARDLAGSEYVIMVRQGHTLPMKTVARAKVAELMTRSAAESIANREMMGVDLDELGATRSTDLNQVMRSQNDNAVVDLLLGANEPPLTSKAGATISAMAAYELLARYCKLSSNGATNNIDDLYSVVFDPTAGTKSKWDAYIRAKAPCSSRVEGESSHLSIPFGWVIRFTFPDWTPLVGNAVMGSIRGTKKLALHSAALEACRRLYEIGALNEYLLPNVGRARKPNAFSLPRLYNSMSNGHSRNGNIALSEDADKSEAEQVLVEYKRAVPKVFQRDEMWRDIDLETTKITQSVRFYVTVISFGPELELFTLGDSPYVPGPTTTARRSLAILTRRPLSAGQIPQFQLWLGGTTSCNVELLNYNGMGEHVLRTEDETDDRGHFEEESVTFSSEQANLISKFQRKFWSYVVRKPALKPLDVLGKRKRSGLNDEEKPIATNGNGGNAIRSNSIVRDNDIRWENDENHTQQCSMNGEDGDQRVFFVLPMIGALRLSSDQRSQTWDFDWAMVRRVVHDTSCTLYDYICRAADGTTSISRSEADASCTTNNPGDASLTNYDIRIGHVIEFDALLEPASPTQSEDRGEATTRFRADVASHVDKILSQTMAFTPHNKIKYVLHRLVTGVQPTTTFKKSRSNEDLTYKGYVEQLGYKVPHDLSAMVEAHQAGSFKNMLKPPFRSRDQQKPSRKGRQGRPVMLTPDASYIVPFPLETYRLAMIFPSVLHKVEMYSLVLQLREEMGLHQVKLETLFSAFCAPSAQESTNYERLETLGDSFLKYAASLDLFVRFPFTDEGSLSARRSRIVSNKNLFSVADARGFGALLIVTPFFSRYWSPPGFQPVSVASRSPDEDDEGESPYQSKRGDWWRLISQKMLADFVEALIGASYTDGGNDVAMRLLATFGLVSETLVRIITGANQGDTHVRDQRGVSMKSVYESHANASPGMPSAGLSAPVEFDAFNEITLEQAAIQHIEKTLRYCFRDRALLCEAMTHNSGIGKSYQRLEFLGDAVLDWVLTRFFFNSYPSLSPAALTDLRQAAVNNESFSRLSVRLGLHRCVRHNSSAIQADIDKYVGYLDTLEAEADPSRTTHEGPKVLGDVFEALAGAVLVDSGYDISTMWMVFRPLMIEFLEVHANPEVVNKSPVRQLHEFFQQRGFAVNDVAFQYESDNRQESHTCHIYVLDTRIASATGNSRHLAKRLATFEGLDWIKRSEDQVVLLLDRSKELRMA